MQMIAAVDKNWGIGRKGKLLVSIPQDMKLFRNETMGHVIVMGRKTLESFPGQKPLPGRTNVVLTRDASYEVKGAVVVHSESELQEVLAGYESDDIYVIGGEQIYRLLLPLCDTAHITKIDHAYEADAFFPNLDNDPAWEISAASEEQTYFDLEYRFLCYRRKQS